LQQTLEAAQPRAQQAGHKLIVTPPVQPVYLDADPVRLTQVFLNLLNNACKYTAKGGHIELSAERDGTDVVVKVTDTGIGIPPEYQPGLFVLFSQVPSSPEQKEGGLGIGLSLARSLVEMHGGTIEVHSEGTGKGSQFSVRLPALDVPSILPSASANDNDEVKPGKLRVLVVDDNQDIVESLAMLLKISGHEVATARDGLQAIELAERFRPNVVLLDIGMPGLDGHDTCRMFRRQAWGKDIKIFALSGLGSEQDLLKSQQAGFTDHLIKPVDPDELIRLLAD
jgi:CheY-like chemotaxis protein